MKKLYVTFTEAANSYTNHHGFSKLNKQKNLKEGYDWKLKEFASQELMDAYLNGVDDANRCDEVEYCELTVENELLKPKYIITHSMDGENTITELCSDGELIDFVNDIAIRNEDEALTSKDEAFDYIVSSCENLLIKTIY